jgi:hypothetical protein
MVLLMPFIHAPAVMSDEADGLFSDLISSFTFTASFGASDTAGAVFGADEARDNPLALRPSGPSNDSPFFTVIPSVGNVRDPSPLYV